MDVFATKMVNSLNLFKMFSAFKTNLNAKK